MTYHNDKISVIGGMMHLNKRNDVNDNICYFIHTCDDYEQFWNGWHESYRKFWPKDLDWKVYFVNEEKDI